MFLRRLFLALWTVETAGWALILWKRRDLCPLNTIIEFAVYPPPGYLFWCAGPVLKVAIISLGSLILATIAFAISKRMRKSGA
jgi:hypothetical protein